MPTLPMAGLIKGGLVAPGGYTLADPLSGSTLGTFVRGSNAWNPDSGAIAPHNYFLNSAVFVTQNVTTTAQVYVLSLKGSGTITISGTGSGALTGSGSTRTSLTFTATAGTCTFTLSGGAGTVTEAQLNAQALTDYVSTTAAAVYAPRYVTGKAGQGYLAEPSSTNKTTCYSVPRASGTYGSTLASGTAALGKVYEIVQRTGVDWEAVGTRLSGTANTVGAQYLITGSLTFDADDTGKEAIDAVGVKSFYSGSFIQNIPSMTLSGDTAATVQITQQTAILAAGRADTSISQIALAVAANNGNKVYTLTTGAGGAASVDFTGAMSAVTSSMGLMVYVASGSVTVTDSAGANGSSAYTTAAWTRLKKENFTATATRTVRLTAAANTVVHFLNPTLEELPYLTTGILGTTGSATTRLGDSLSYSTSVVIGTPGTISTWWKPQAVATGTVQTIWSSYTGAADYTSIKSNGVIVYLEKAKTGQVTEYVTFPLAAVAGTWYHVAAVINSDGTCQLYVNNVAASAGLGNELLNDPTLDNAGSWTVVAPVAISGGVATWSGQSTNYAISQASKLTLYRLYNYNYEILTMSGGQLQPWYAIGSLVLTPTINSTGVKNVPAFALGTTAGLSSYTATTATVANLSVKEIYNSTSTAFAPVLASTMQAGAFNSTLQANGVLDGERYYTRALSADEIAKLYRLNGR